MKKIIILFTVLVLSGAFAIFSFGENSEYTDTIKKLDDSEVYLKENFYKTEDNSSYELENKEIVTMYSATSFFMYLRSSIEKSEKFDLHNLLEAEHTENNKYYYAYDDSEIFHIDSSMSVKLKKFDDTWQDFIKYENAEEIEIYGGKYKLIDVMYFIDYPFSFDEINVFLTDKGIFIKNSYFNIYPMNDFVKIYSDYLKYDKPINIIGGSGYSTYFREIFPFIDNEEPVLNPQVKDVELDSFEDISSLKQENIDDLKENFKNTDVFSVDEKNVVLTYYGVLDIKGGNLYDIIENAERKGQRRYIVYDENQAFKVNSEYEVSNAVFDYNYMFSLITYYENMERTVTINNKTHVIQDIVYFWDIKQGLIAFYLTDHGIVMNIRKNTFAAEKNYTLDDLYHFEECYEKKKVVSENYWSENYWRSLVFYVWEHDSVDHEKLEEEYQSIISKQTPIPTQTPSPTPTVPSATPTQTLTPTTPAVTPTPVEEPKSSVLWISLGGAAVILLAVVSTFVYRKKIK